MVSGSISLLYSRFFSPFPHGTGSLSVSQKYLALPDGTGRFRRDFAGPALLRIPLCSKSLRGQGYHLLWLTFPGNLASFFSPISWSYNPVVAVTTMVWALPCSLATTYGIILIFSSSGYLDVSVLRVCSLCSVTSLQLAGLPHSEISGSLRMCQSPELIAAYHVFPRLWEPRHPPYALSNFLKKIVYSLLVFTVYSSFFSYHYVKELYLSC